MSGDKTVTEKHRLFLARSVVELGVFSAVINGLLLVMPLYLLQIYDRILPASNLETLIYLSILALFSLVVLGILEIIRALYANRISARLDSHLGAEALLAAMNGPGAAAGDVQPIRDLSVVRAFVSSRAVFYLFDLPFAPLFVAMLYLVHPTLFVVALIGAVLLLAMAMVNHATTSKTSQNASSALSSNMSFAQAYARNAETVRTLGMLSNTVEHWGAQFAKALAISNQAASRNAFYSGISRSIRMLLQIAVLGLGAYLVLAGEMTAGMIFAASIISGRALQPLDQIISASHQIVEAKRAYARLGSLAGSLDHSSPNAMSGSSFSGRLSVEKLVYLAPNSDVATPPLIKRLGFNVSPGETVAIIGPSKAGKSTLVRLIVGAINPHSGVVRLDGADISQFDPDFLGKHLGYLPQDVELFHGTIAQNISRFEPGAQAEVIINAAKMAHCHELILSQPDGYETVVGPGELRVSGGERQRIGLARALFGSPKLVVLDEPNAHLDSMGEQALEHSMRDVQASGATILIVTHKPSIASRCDRVLVLKAGQIEMYGPSDDVISRLDQGGVRTVKSMGFADKPVTSPSESVTSASHGQLVRERRSR